MGTNTGIGIGIGIPFKNNVLGEGKPYLPPEIKDSLKAVVIAYGKTNNDSDRAIVKNLVDPDNPFVISNAAYKLNSGYGKYEEDFTSWDKIDASTAEISNDGSKIKCINTILNVQYLFNSINKDIPSFKVKISNFTKGNIAYYYRKEDGTEAFLRIEPSPLDKVLELPKSYNTVEGGTGSRGGFYSSNINIGVTIEQIPSFQGAFVTDGIDDLITSTKTVQEMGITDEITVVSMIGHLSTPNVNNYTNTIRNQRGTTGSYNKIAVSAIDKTGIYGYSFDSSLKCSIINDILGDKQDYSVSAATQVENIGAKYLVQGWIDINGLVMELSSVAWYWTIIANKVLTTDQINQVIAYFNLDKTLKPDMLCNITKQGITNDNHADFNDKLIDYSGNGRDIQMNNLAWKGDSGIGKYETDFTTWIRSHFTDEVNFTPSKIEVTGILATNSILINKKPTPIYNVEIHSPNKSIVVYYQYNDDTGVKRIALVDGINELPSANDSLFVTSDRLNSKGITITQIPSHAGALCLDGVNDFGKVTGMPIYKDYTIIADYERFYLEPITGGRASILSKSSKVGDGSFIFNLEDQDGGKACYTFGGANGNISDDITRIIRYQSKYYNTKTLSIGTAEDNDFMVLGKVREVDSRHFYGVIYSLMTFPYSMSEFLIERQLKKHKLGTLYPDMVEFRPIVKSNSEYQVVGCYIDTLPAVVGNYYPINSKLRIAVTTKGAADKVTSLTVNGVSLGTPSVNGNRFTFNGTLSDKSPQKINITIDEYIRYEDIVQPYPSLFTLIDYDTEEVYSWGSKLKVGARFKGNVVNLLPNMYEWQGDVLYNGEVLNWGINPGVVAKEMVFSWNMPFKYLIDNNEPKVILSPRLLRIPNSSYKILGYIPDISGHGNHGKINNSAYASMSGANGYLLDFKTFTTGNSSLVNIKDDSRIEVININKEKSTTFVNLNKSTSISLSSWKIKVTGMRSGDTLGYYYSESTDATLRSKFDIKSDGIYSLPSSIANSNNIGGIAFDVVAGADSAYRIEQIGEYEGAYCLDGVDDFVTIPTTVGGKQVLMKVNWNSLNHVLYDQRNNAEAPFCIVAASGTIAYNQRNVGGNTYIDGILNNHILVDDLQAITHNIVLNNDYNVANSNSFIGTKYTKSIYAQMSLYDFMLFDEISTDDKIKELNEYVGIEAKVELPPYYWDTYGKTNSDEDKATVQQRGVAIGDYDLTNYNHAYDKMSGYGGYSFSPFSNTNDWRLSSSDNTMELLSIDGYSFTARRLEGSTWWKYKNKVTTNVSKNLTIKIRTNKSVRINWELKYRTSEMPDADTTLGLVSTLLSPNVITDVVLPVKTEEELNTLGAISHFYLIFFPPIDVPVGEEYTVEMLPLYPNGLVYDAITDYSENVNIPVFTDFTAIMKRKWLKNQGCPLIKGSKVYEGGNGNALLFEWDKAYNFVFYKRTDIMEREVPENISFITPTNYNGNVIIRGSGQDTNGICIAGDGNAGFANIVFYKLILYPKTIPLLQINFLKNLMERDEIIDLNNPIFIKNE